MNTKKKLIIAAGSILLLLPVVFLTIMRREVAGSMTTFTVRGTTARIYLSDAGSFAFACRSKGNRLDEPRWCVTRSQRGAWTVANAGALYLGFPFLITDIFSQKN